MFAGRYKYRWKDSLWKTHLSAIREFTGYRAINKHDRQQLVKWLMDEAESHPSRSKMFDAAVNRCRQIRLELPREKEFRRLVHSAWQQYLDVTCRTIAERLDSDIRKRINTCVDVDPNDAERYDWMKTKPGKFGMKTLLHEIRRLRFVNAFAITPDFHLEGVPEEVLRLLRERATTEDAYQMRRHPEDYCYALMAVLLYFRRMELIDTIVDIFLHLVRRIEKKADKSLERDLVARIQSVFKKRELLYKMAKASTQNPHDTIENVLFPVIGEDVLNRIVAEYEGRDLDYDRAHTKEKKKKYTRSYRRMLKPVLDILVFRTANPACGPLMSGLELVRNYLGNKSLWYPETEMVPLDLLRSIPEALWLDKNRVVKHYFELCVLQKLEKALKNKEVWVEGAFRYRNADKDLPLDWNNRWGLYLAKHRISLHLPSDFRFYLLSLCRFSFSY